MGVAEVRWLLASSVLARLPLGMCSLAVLLFVRSRTGSFLAAGLTVGVFTGVGVVTAPVQGILLDRLGQLRVLLPCAGGEAALLFALVFVANASAPVAVILAVAAMAGALVPPVSACVRALWSVVIPERATRETAYVLDATVQEIIWTLGPMLVAVTVSVVSTGAAVLLCGVITLLGTILFASSPLVRSWQPVASSERTGRSPIGDGALVSPGLRALLATVVLAGVVIGALEVGLPALAANLGSPSSAGLLLAVWSVGSMAGGLLYGTRRWSGSPGARHRTLLLGACALTAPLLLARSLAAAVALGTLAGVFLAPMFSCQYTLVGRLAPCGAITEAFTWQVAAVMAGVAAGSALAGALVDMVGVRATFALGCLSALAAYAIALLERTKIESAAVVD